jgi:hypothetical protein
LFSLRLREATIRNDFPSPPPSAGIEATTAFNPSAWNRAEHVLTMEVRFLYKLTWRPEPEREPVELMSLTCTLQADYAVRPGYEPTDEEITAFHHGNAVFNAWPYFREYVHSSTARMLLPPPPVPFLKLRPKGSDAAGNRTGRKRAPKLSGSPAAPEPVVAPTRDASE